MHQIQCPNCGGYQLDFGNRPWFRVGLWFFYLIFPAFICLKLNRQRERSIFLEGRKRARCELCGYSFYVHQLPPEPIEPKQRLIQSGREKLKREEELDWLMERSRRERQTRKKQR